MKRTFYSQYVKNEEIRLLQDNAFNRERRVRRGHKLLDTRSPTVDSIIVDELKQRPPCRTLEDVPSRYKVDKAICALANRKPVGPDGLSAELLNGLADEGELNTPRYHRRCVEGRWRAAPIETFND